MAEYTATNIGELTAVIVGITRAYGNAKAWWRGHSDREWDLLPSLYRKGFEKKETNMNGRFRSMAKARHGNCPANEDIFSWLFLMQHYRLPTRLLDWSESPLVAIYFAVESQVDDAKDGALWAILPTGLNLKQLGKENICMSGSRDLRQLCTEAFVKNQNNPDTRILSVLTDQRDLRHMVQQSAFTIHGSGIPVNRLPESETYLSKIIIPAQSKPGFRQVLDLFGISRAGLFPDLENLSLELSSLEFSR